MDRFFRKSNLHRAHGLQFFRFLLVGLLNTAIGYSLFVLFSVLGFEAAFALAFTYVFGAISNFFTTGKLVFGATNLKYFLRFLSVYVAIYAVNLGFLTLLIGAGIEKLISQAILVPFMAILSFLAFKVFAFRGA